jgi:Virulence protein RhuM family
MNKKNSSIARSSAAEYLTFVAAGGSGGIEAVYAADGKSYDTNHYNLAAIIAVGYKVNSERAVQFRKWATGIIESFTIKETTDIN